MISRHHKEIEKYKIKVGFYFGRKTVFYKYEYLEKNIRVLSKKSTKIDSKMLTTVNSAWWDNRRLLLVFVYLFVYISILEEVVCNEKSVMSHL